MSTRIQIPAKPDANWARSFTPAPVVLLQRKCSCGGSAGSGGDCAECKKKKLQRRAAGTMPESVSPIVHEVLRSPDQPLDAPTWSSFEPRFGHDFGMLRIHSDDNASESAGPFHARVFMGTACGPLPPTIGRSDPLTMFQVPVDAPIGTEDADGEVLSGGESSTTQQVSDEESQLSGDSGQAGATAGDSPFSTGSGAPLCHNGGGVSSCDILSGIYRITSNDNTCCTRDCTQQHEQRHVQDLGDCCKQAFQARKDSANPNKVTAIYNQWLDAAQSRTECNAYSTDVRCATAMAKANDCNEKGKDSACCLSISSYKSRYKDLADEYCKAAPAKIPPCPNFALAVLVGD